MSSLRDTKQKEPDAAPRCMRRRKPEDIISAYKRNFIEKMK